MVKFADDTTLTGLISKSDESVYRQAVSRLLEWCDENNLELNASKTKEIVVDFRTKTTPIAPLVINGDVIEQVDSFKFLGTTISHDLKWEDNITTCVKKAQQRLFFLRRLKKFGLCRKILELFYRSTIESILTFSIAVWYGTSTQQQRKKLDRVVRTASRIVGTELTPIDDIFRKRAVSRARLVIKDGSHPANHLFTLLPSKKRYRSMRTRTVRYHDSLFPTTIRLLNDG